MANYQAAPAPTAEDPGKTLGIVGLVLAIVAPVIGIIVSAIARGQSQKAGFQNQYAKIGLIIGIILTVIGLIGGIAYAIFIVSVIGSST
jgi:hypothetical protein